MLDDPRTLRDAAEGYRAKATAAGLAWPGPTAPPAGPAPELVYRLFDVDHIAEQLVWLESQGWDSQRIFPNGGELLPWPSDPAESLDQLSFSVATPFLWRHQLPLFHFGFLVYTFVLAGDHEGEIWRYEASPDAWDSVRAATSLAALFTEWTNGITTGVVGYRNLDGWLMIDDRVHDLVEIIQERAPGLDPLAFPVSMAQQPLLRARQRECGVDMECVDRGAECQRELLDAIATTRAAFGG